MATVAQLVAAGKLIPVKGVLKENEMPFRELYLLPKAAQWMRQTLPNLEPDGFVDGAIWPNQQAFNQFRDFLIGENLNDHDYYPKPMRPKQPEHGIWELRTPDLRFFGWFVAKGRFVISAVAAKSDVADHHLCAGYRNQAVSDYSNMELDEPKFLIGEYSDVF